jgi:hypothetical protein
LLKSDWTDILSRRMQSKTVVKAFKDLVLRVYLLHFAGSSPNVH